MRSLYILLFTSILFSCTENKTEITVEQPDDVVMAEDSLALLPDDPAEDTIEEDTDWTSETPDHKPVKKPKPTLEKPEEKPQQPDHSSWSINNQSNNHTVTGSNTLIAVRTSSNDYYDRIVFEFEGKEMPSWHTEYIDKPVRQCGSGNTTPIAGDGWLEIRFEPVNAHTEEGKPTIPYREKKYSGYRNLKEVERTCDFEAVTTYVAGFNIPNGYRIMELKNPTRLVVDVSNIRKGPKD